MTVLEFGRHACDTLAAGAHALGASIDRRKAALPRLLSICDGEQLGTEMEEVFGAVWSLVFGFWLLLPFDTFGGSKAFRILNDISVEPLWGLALLVFALWRLDAITMNRIRARHALTMMGVNLWGALAVFFVLGNVTSPAGALFGVVAALETLSYRNKKAEAL